jgi:uncharacterized protein
VTTNYVLVETVSIIRRRLGLRPALTRSDTLLHNQGVGLFWVEPVHHQEAMRLMTTQADKEWSLTDSASFVIMRSLGIQDAFTFDQDFTQAGFISHP